MATIADVARLAGVSAGTVSNVINHPDQVKPKTMARVQEAMHALQFAPNAAARTLSMGEPQNIGVVIPSIRHPYFTYLLRGVSEAAFPTGYRVTLLSSNYEQQIERQYLRELQQHSYAALIMTSRQMPLDEVQALAGTRRVVCCEDVGDRPISSVAADRRPAYQEALEWVYQRGYRNVAVLAQRSPDISETTSTLLAAYQAVYGEPLSQQRLYLGVVDSRDGHATAQRLMVRDPEVDFIFTNGDDVAAGVVMAYREAGREKPGVMGSEYQLSSRLLGLPSINHHLGTMGHLAFNLAIAPEIKHRFVRSEFMQNEETSL